MAIIQFTESDKLTAIVVDVGWYKAIVKSIDMKASSSGKSVNFWAEFELTEGKYAHKEMKCCFNTETNNSSLLGGAQFRPHSDMLVLYSAVKNVPLAEVPLNFDTDELLMKEFDLQVLVDVAEGAPLNKTGAFIPAGKASGAGTVTF